MKSNYYNKSIVLDHSSSYSSAIESITNEYYKETREFDCRRNWDAEINCYTTYNSVMQIDKKVHLHKLHTIIYFLH